MVAESGWEKRRGEKSRILDAFWRSRRDLRMRWMQSTEEGVKDDFEALGLLSYSSAQLNLSTRPFLSSWHCLQSTVFLSTPLLPAP